MICLMIRKASVPESSGEISHDETIRSSLALLTASIPNATAPKPAIAPTIECVVETGQPSREATISQVPAAVSEASIPNFSVSSDAVVMAGSRIPPRIVFVTCPPTSHAPRNSKMAATITACTSVNAREPTDVPMAFATSFAPIA